MKVKPVYVFQADAYNPVQHEFSDKKKLYDFIHAFDFRHLYSIEGKPIRGLITRGFRDQQFQIGARLAFEIDGYEVKSNTIWGPKYYIGRSALVSDNVIHVEMPVVPGILYGNRWYSEYIKPYTPGDMVFDPVRMRQVYPPCNGRPSELTQFVQKIEKQAYTIEKTR